MSFAIHIQNLAMIIEDSNVELFVADCEVECIQKSKTRPSKTVRAAAGLGQLPRRFDEFCTVLIHRIVGVGAVRPMPQKRNYQVSAQVDNVKPTTHQAISMPFISVLG